MNIESYSRNPESIFSNTRSTLSNIETNRKNVRNIPYGQMTKKFYLKAQVSN